MNPRSNLLSTFGDSARMNGHEHEFIAPGIAHVKAVPGVRPEVDGASSFISPVRLRERHVHPRTVLNPPKHIFHSKESISSDRIDKMVVGQRRVLRNIITEKDTRIYVDLHNTPLVKLLPLKTPTSYV